MNMQEKTKEISTEMFEIDKQLLKIDTSTNARDTDFLTIRNCLRNRRFYLRAFLDGLHYAERITE